MYKNNWVLVIGAKRLETVKYFQVNLIPLRKTIQITNNEQKDETCYTKAS